MVKERARAVTLSFALAFPSLYLIDKHLGPVAIAPYVAYVVTVVSAWQKHQHAAAAAMGERRARWLLLATFTTLVAAFLVIHPIANSGRFGKGSDADQALNQATKALLCGDFPYRERTYLGNPISPMPGSLLLAAPFVSLFGTAALQTLAWLAAGAALVWRAWNRSAATTLLFCWTVLLACPAIPHLLFIGHDYTANSLMVMVFAILLLTSVERQAHLGVQALWALSFGVSLSSRANFVFLLPLLASRLAQIGGLRRSAALTALAIGAGAAVTLPFLLYDPAAFSPLHTLGKLREIEGTLPHARWLIPSLAAALSLALARPKWNADLPAFLRNAALVQALMVMGRSALWFIGGRKPMFAPSLHGQFFLIFWLGYFVTTDRATGTSSPDRVTEPRDS